MSDLDKKLDLIFRERIDDAGNTNCIALAEDIKQAFIDAGWVEVPSEAQDGVRSVLMASHANMEYYRKQQV